MKRTVLVLTASYGEGHNSAARAVAAALAEHPDCHPELADLFALTAPRLNNLTRTLYLSVINRAPQLWRRAYGWLDRSRHAALLFRALPVHERKLQQLVARHRPAALCATYPAYAWLWQRWPASERLACPLHTVVTDAITINSLWYRAASTGWHVTDRDSAALLRAYVPADRVHCTGFPVALPFADRPATLRPPEPAPGEPRRILYMVNGGEERAFAAVARLARSPDWALTVTAGRSAALRARFEALARDAAARITVLGWTDRIPELLMTHHAVVSKAGGATTQEALNALCPMVVSQIVPGQEEGNWELLRRHEAGSYAATPEAIERTLHDLFTDDARLWRLQRAHLRRLARPDAARQVAGLVLNRTAAAQPRPVGA
jgi:processive 1,2-diacylglycerol beta-glucosyltransferase